MTDYDALIDEHMKRYPNIRAALANREPKIVKTYRGQDVEEARTERDRLKTEGKNAYLTRNEGARGVQCTYDLWVSR